jgi:hypothetical protein
VNQITVTQEKKMTVAQRKEQMPYEILADGEVVAIVRTKQQDSMIDKITCPNCKFVVSIPKETTNVSFFSVKHP